MISILEDGWTQPIVINNNNEIVDGFHRWMVSGRKALLARFHGLVPVVRITPDDAESQRMATIRHNRARGTHGVLDMANIVRDLIAAKVSLPEIMHRLQMEKEEVIRLSQRVGIPQSDIVTGGEFGKAWDV